MQSNEQSGTLSPMLSNFTTTPTPNILRTHSTITNASHMTSITDQLINVATIDPDEAIMMIPKRREPILNRTRKYGRHNTYLNSCSSSGSGSMLHHHFSNMHDTVKTGNLDEILGFEPTETNQHVQKQHHYRQKKGIQKSFDVLFKVSVNKRFNEFGSSDKDYEKTASIKNGARIEDMKVEKNSKTIGTQFQVHEKFRKKQNHEQANIKFVHNRTSNFKSQPEPSNENVEPDHKEVIDAQPILRKKKNYAKRRLGILQYKQSKEGYQNSHQSPILQKKTGGMQKYFQKSLTRYNVKELQSLHHAILQYSKGDIGLIKKSLVVVLNMSGILIEQAKLNEMGTVLQRNYRNTTPTKKKAVHQQLSSCSKQKQSLGNIGSKSQKSITSISNKHILEMQKKSKQKMKRVLEEHLESISNFDSFLELYKTIEMYYFKQSIIDYLHILLEGVKKFTPERERKNVTLILADADSMKEDSDQDDAEVGYEELYEAFRKRNTDDEALVTVDMISMKVKQLLQDSMIHRQIQPQRQKKELGSNWRVSLRTLYKMCYHDNQLCQIIHEFYMKQKSKSE